MKLEEFSDIHKNLLKSWFDKNEPSNVFIGFYSKPDRWLKLISSQRIAYAATMNRRMVGFVDLELSNDNAASFAFGIDPSMRGKGLGSKLVKEIEKAAKEHGAMTLFAGVENGNIACQKVLEKAGYSTAPSEDGMIGYIKVLQ